MQPSDLLAELLTATCACGAVKAALQGPFRAPLGCHCETCRRQSGHFVAATQIRLSDFKLLRSDHLKWWRATKHAERGFCDQCGSLMFWRKDHDTQISIFMGCIDGTVGMQLVDHIHLDEKADYYDV